MTNRSATSLAKARFALACAAVLWGLAASAVPQVVPSITLNAGGIAISGLTPGASAIVLSISRQTRGGIAGYGRHDYLLRAADAGGNATVNLAVVPPISVWCVVDLRTGLYAVTAPLSYPIRRIPFPANALRASSNAQLNRLRLKHDFLEVLWVRPGVGTWKTSVGDGGESDADHIVDGNLSIAPEQMEALGGSPPPPNHYLPSDTFILVNPDTMELLAIPVTQ
jgi:hypothetical protein